MSRESFSRCVFKVGALLAHMGSDNVHASSCPEPLSYGKCNYGRLIAGKAVCIRCQSCQDDSEILSMRRSPTAYKYFPPASIIPCHDSVSFSRTKPAFSSMSADTAVAWKGVGELSTYRKKREAAAGTRSAELVKCRTAVCTTKVRPSAGRSARTCQTFSSPC